MAARILSGIQIAEQNGPGHAVMRASTGVTAFVGRTLKGPVNQAVSIANFADFQRIFGGLWQPSTLSYAVEQFFDNGGTAAVVVRVANGGRPPTMVLGSGASALSLTGLIPGSREHLRASVDHDGIGANETDRFNLVVQRVRGANSELVEDQEIFRRVSVRPESGRYVVDAVAESRMVRVTGRIPTERPGITPAEEAGGVIGYVCANNDGDDGAPLTDYDVIGSAQTSTGLFALQGAVQFNLLCIPPLGRDQDVGASTLLVAAKFCRERHALLVVDPPQAWTNASQAIDGMRDWPFRADNAVMYFPRMIATDRLRGRPEIFASCGAVAGMLARADAASPLWSPIDHDEVLLRHGFRAACSVSDAERARLSQCGINTLSSVRVAHNLHTVARTLATGNTAATDWRYLAPRRLAQFIAQSIEQGTRWVLFAGNTPETWRRAQMQVLEFLSSLDDEGAFPGSLPGEGFFAICDARLNDPAADPQVMQLLYGYAGARAGEMHSFLVTHGGGRSGVRSAAANRYTTSGRRVGEEIEAGLLRGLQDR